MELGPKISYEVGGRTGAKDRRLIIILPDDDSAPYVGLRTAFEIARFSGLNMPPPILVGYRWLAANYPAEWAVMRLTGSDRLELLDSVDA